MHPMKIEVLFEDTHIWVINKPSGLHSVPGRGDDKQDCAVSQLQERKNKDGKGEEVFVVHRLDRDTSGLLVFAKTKDDLRELHRQFRDGEVDKEYVAVVHGQLPAQSGEVNLPLIVDWPNRPKQHVNHETGKPSLTHYTVQHFDASRNISFVLLTPVTGRTHQLRVHMLVVGCPMLGDSLYGVGDAEPRLMLHAAKLSFTHPVTAGRMNYEQIADFNLPK